MAFVYDLTDTWNAGGTTFNAIKMNVTDTASAAASKLITVQVGGAEKFSVRKDGLTYVAGSLGVGTSSPTDKLTVDSSTTTGISVVRAGSDRVRAFGDGTLAWGATANQGTLTWNTNLAVIQANSGNSLAFNTNGNSERMRITSAGLVGIGTSSPSAKLTVSSGDILLSNAYSLKGRNAADTLSIGMMRRNASDQVAIDEDGYGTVIGASGVLGVYGSGNVGIGTSSPADLLHVKGSTAAVSDYQIIAEGVVGGYGAGVSFQSQLTGGSLAEMARITADGEQPWNTTASTQDAGLRFHTSLDGTVAERMRIDSSGRVGVGTSSPAYPLDVNGNGGQIVARLTETNATLSSRLYATCGTATGMFQQYGQSHPTFPNALNINASAGSLLLSTSSSERMRIDSSGNVGIGTSSPSSLGLQISKGAGIAAGVLFSNSANNWQIATGTTTNFLAITDNQFAERMRIDSSGNLLVGTTTADNKLTVSASSSGAAAGVLSLVNPNDATSTAADLDFVTHSSGTLATGRIRGLVGGADNYPMSFWTYGGGGLSERMRIDSSGNLLVGTTSSSWEGGITDTRQNVVASAGQTGIGVSVNSSSAAFGVIIANKATTGDRRFIGFYAGATPTSVGSIFSSDGTSTTYATSSDARLKDNIADAADAGDLIDAIKVRQFDWKSTGKHQPYGMVAQELMLVAADAVGGDPEGEDMMGVDYSKLVPMLIKEVQSLRARVAQLETSASTITFEGN